MVSSFIGNEVPRKGLRVRIPCPPLLGKSRRKTMKIGGGYFRGTPLCGTRVSIKSHLLIQVYCTNA